ncbi:MAG TPA: DUF1367 family protein [Pseudolabrys sp.]|nr:DUF1367 family protein [Pseudolabrys sp.]
MTEVILRYREARPYEFGLFPVDDEGAELFRGLKINRDIGCDVKQRRNPRHHRLFFAILNFVKLHCSRFENASLDQIKDAVKLACGLTQTFIDAETGEVFYVLKSIAWAAMDQTKFNEFFNNACNVIAKRWMPAGTTAESVRDELLKMVDGPYHVDERRRA